MGYDPRRKWKVPEVLTDEEEDVEWALQQYTADPEVAHPDDFVPTKVLYRIYCRAMREYSRDPDANEPLDISSFGATIPRVFSDLDNADPELGDNPNKVRRRYHGKLMWGYRGLKGPESVRTRDYVGRPPKDPEDYDGR